MERGHEYSRKDRHGFLGSAERVKKRSSCMLTYRSMATGRRVDPFKADRENRVAIRGVNKKAARAGGRARTKTSESAYISLALSLFTAAHRFRSGDEGGARSAHWNERRYRPQPIARMSGSNACGLVSGAGHGL